MTIEDCLAKLDMYQTLFLLKCALEHLDRELDKPQNEITDMLNLDVVNEMWVKHAEEMLRRIDLAIMPYAIEELYSKWRDTEVIHNETNK